MTLPEDFVGKWLPKASGSYFLGVRLTELTRDELLAVAIMGWTEQQEARKLYYDELRKLPERMGL